MTLNTKTPTVFYASYSYPEAFTSTDVTNEQQDISASIIKYNTNFTELNTQSDKYKNDIVDDSGKFLPKNTLKDAVKNDIQVLLIQENTMYIVGVITTASLIITAILISKK
jgi:hypothetical protein